MSLVDIGAGEGLTFFAGGGVGGCKWNYILSCVVKQCNIWE